jgi:hypothetical protein
MAADLRPPLGMALDAFGVPATVTPLGGSPVSATAIRLRGGAPPAIGSLGLSPAIDVDLRPMISVSRAAVPALPVGSSIAADFGEGLQTYRVGRVDDGFPDEWRVVVS